MIVNDLLGHFINIIIHTIRIVAQITGSLSTGKKRHSQNAGFEKPKKTPNKDETKTGNLPSTKLHVSAD
jgi:hypothetical protein